MTATDLIQRYLSVWNTSSNAERKDLMESVFTPHAEYVDPLIYARGIDEIDSVISAAREQLGEMKLQLRGIIDEHHGVARFQWQAGVAGEEEPAVIGFDVVRIAGGLIDQVIGFLDRVPEAA